MHPCHGLLCLSNVQMTTVPNEVGVAHAGLGVLVIENGHGLAPLNLLTVRGIRLNATEQVCGVTAVIVLAAVVVKPVDKLALVPRRCGVGSSVWA